MGYYNDRILPTLIDKAMRDPLHDQLQAKIMPAATGHVLEIGMGSGLNLRHYDWPKVDRLTGLEPSEKLRDLSQQRADKDGDIPLDFVGLDGADIPVDSKSVDTVVLSWVMCTIPDIDQALVEMKRVLKPGGRILFVEHGAAPDRGVHRFQCFVEPAWKRVAGGCHLTRKPDEILARAGFTLDHLHQEYIGAPRFARFTSHGVATIR